MAIADQSTEATAAAAATAAIKDAYNRWIESQEIPIHRGYYIDDVRTVEVAPWEERGATLASSSSRARRA